MPVPAGTLSRVETIWKAERTAMATAMVIAEDPFRERLVWFWANHFTVSARQGQVRAILGNYVRDAIRPNVTTRFADMLMAVMTHPAMLMYLDNEGSIGPNSKAALNIKPGQPRRGLNENLARECLELHTVSPAAGYTQADVTAAAAVLTGWMVDRGAAAPAFVFRPNAHEPGEMRVLGQTFPAGMQGGVAMLTWLGTHPATYAHIARKLVAHFAADAPPPAAVARMVRVLTDTRGDLRAASAELVAMPACWTGAKLRPPMDYLVAAAPRCRPAGGPAPEPRERDGPDGSAAAERAAAEWVERPRRGLGRRRGVAAAGRLGLVARGQAAGGRTGGGVRRRARSRRRSGPASGGQGCRFPPRRFGPAAVVATDDEEIAVLVSRRSALLGLTAAVSLGASSLAVAAAGTRRRLVVVLLRGAMDGLGAVVPYGDPDLAAARPALPAGVVGDNTGLLDLGGFFGLRPELAALHAAFTDNAAVVLHAVAGEWRVRSHFEAQDYLESGAERRLGSGWLNRVAQALPAVARRRPAVERAGDRGRRAAAAARRGPGRELDAGGAGPPAGGVLRPGRQPARGRPGVRPGHRRRPA